jgi:hypothetical protein
MGDVVKFKREMSDGLTSNDLFEYLQERDDIESAIVLSRVNDGYILSTTDNITDPEILWMMERLKESLLHGE